MRFYGKIRVFYKTTPDPFFILIAKDARQADEKYAQAGKTGDAEQIKGSMGGH